MENDKIDIKNFSGGFHMENKKYGIVVVGAGPAGIAAALTSARGGVPTALIERYGCVGGGLTSMYVRPLLGGVKNVNIGREIEQRLGDYKDFMSPVESAKCVLTEMLREADVDVYLQTPITLAEVHNGRITAVHGVNRARELCFTADQFIDATGDGDLSAAAGCEIAYGRDGDGLVQPVSIMFTIEGVSPDQHLLCGHEEDYQQLSNGCEYLDLCHKACASGELPPSVNIVRLYSTGRTGERMVNATQMNRVNPLEPSALFDAEFELRRQIRQIVAFLKNKIPGFENIRVNGSCTTLGVRESRRVMGDYVLTGEDLISGRKFDDAVVHDANFCIDIHNPDGAGQAETEGCPHRAKDYDIPYRCLCPRGIDNLLTAGRCISGDHRAHASYRVMRICMAMGHAAGAAALLCVKGGLSTRQVPIRELQNMVNIQKGV